MAKIIIVLCALVACVAAKPGVVAPLAAAYATPYAAPLTYAAPAAFAAPLAYANAHLDAATASHRVDIRQNYNAAVVPAAYAAAPLAYSAHVAAPAAIATHAAVAAPLTYVNAPLDAAYASSRVDIRQNYNAAVVPAAYAAAPVAAHLTHAAPVTYTAPAAVAAPVAVAAPLSYVNAPLDAAYASSRVDHKQNYNAAIVPATYAAAHVAAAPLAAAPSLW